MEKLFVLAVVLFAGMPTAMAKVTDNADAGEKVQEAQKNVIKEADKASAVEKTKTDKEITWMNNLSAAKKLAKKENKLVLVDFSGSDWCGWCMKLEKEVFSKDAFKEFAKDKLVLVMIDFPQKKEQTKRVKRYNNKLAQKYRISGFPTVLLLNHKGEILVHTGYRQGGAEKYVKFLQDEIERIEKAEQKQKNEQKPVAKK